jgi:hypothetical protein
MAAEHRDVAADMAAAWDRIHRHGHKTQPIDMWPCCHILAESGLILGQEEELGAISIGPFRVASAQNEHATRDFIEVLFPVTIAALPSAQPLVAAVSGVLSTACLAFVRLLDRGVIFGRSHSDQVRWAVLTYIAGCNANEACPTALEVTTSIASTTDLDVASGTAGDAIKWLIDRGLVAEETNRLKALI